MVKFGLYVNIGNRAGNLKNIIEKGLRKCPNSLYLLGGDDESSPLGPRAGNAPEAHKLATSGATGTF